MGDLKLIDFISLKIKAIKCAVRQINSELRWIDSNDKSQLSWDDRIYVAEYQLSQLEVKNFLLEQWQNCINTKISLIRESLLHMDQLGLFHYLTVGEKQQIYSFKC